MTTLFCLFLSPIIILPYASTKHSIFLLILILFSFFFRVRALQARAVELSLIPYRRSSSTHYTVCRSPFSPLLFDGPHLMDFGPNQRPSTLFKSVSLHFIPLVTLPLFHYLVLFSLLLPSPSLTLHTHQSTLLNNVSNHLGPSFSSPLFHSPFSLP
jgi:hypothetical protein